jgi:hypothetical protein
LPWMEISPMSQRKPQWPDPAPPSPQAGPALLRPLSHATGPNAFWCIDLKGHFAVGSTRCHSLTVNEVHSGHLLGCVALNRPDGMWYTREIGGGRWGECLLGHP